MEVKYEQTKINYIWPERPSTYTPDFVLPKKGGIFYVESKGIFDTADRQKHILIRQQMPDLDIRFVFSNMNQKIYKNSPTTYAMWCQKHDFLFANKTIPETWLTEGEAQ